MKTEWTSIEDQLPEVGDIVACMADHKDGGKTFWAGVVVEKWGDDFAIMETRDKNPNRFIITFDTEWIKLPES